MNKQPFDFLEDDQESSQVSLPKRLRSDEEAIADSVEIVPFQSPHQQTRRSLAGTLARTGLLIGVLGGGIGGIGAAVKMHFDSKAQALNERAAELEREKALVAARSKQAQDSVAAARSETIAAVGSLTEAQQRLQEATALLKRKELEERAYQDALLIANEPAERAEVLMTQKIAEVHQMEGEEHSQIYGGALRSQQNAVRANLDQLARSLDEVFQRKLSAARDDATRAALIAENELGISPEIITEFNSHTLLNEEGNDSCSLPNGALSENRCTVFTQFRNAGTTGKLNLIYDNAGNPWPSITQIQANRFVAAMIRQFGGKVNPRTMQRFQQGIESALSRGEQRFQAPQQR